MKTLLILNVFHILTWSEGGDYLMQIKTEFSHQPHQYHEPIMTSKSGDSPREKWKDEDVKKLKDKLAQIQYILDLFYCPRSCL